MSVSVSQGCSCLQVLWAAASRKEMCSRTVCVRVVGGGARSPFVVSGVLCACLVLPFASKELCSGARAICPA